MSGQPVEAIQARHRLLSSRSWRVNCAGYPAPDSALVQIARHAEKATSMATTILDKALCDPTSPKVIWRGGRGRATKRFLHGASFLCYHKAMRILISLASSHRTDHRAPQGNWSAIPSPPRGGTMPHSPTALPEAELLLITDNVYTAEIAQLLARAGEEAQMDPAPLRRPMTR